MISDIRVSVLETKLRSYLTSPRPPFYVLDLLKCDYWVITLHKSHLLSVKDYTPLLENVNPVRGRGALRAPLEIAPARRRARKS